MSHTATGDGLQDPSTLPDPKKRRANIFGIHIYLSIYLSIIYISIYTYIYIHLYIYLCISLFSHATDYLSFYLFISQLSNCLYKYQSIYPPIHQYLYPVITYLFWISIFYLSLCCSTWMTSLGSRRPKRPSPGVEIYEFSSHVKSLVNLLSWLLIGCSFLCSQSGASLLLVDSTLDNDYNL